MKNSFPLSINKTTVAVFLITFTSFLLNIYTLGDKSIWLDEATSILLAKNIFTNFISIASQETNMLVYYVLLHYWLFFGDSEFSIRFMSALFSTLSIPLMYIMGRNLFNSKVGILSAILLAFNSTFITYAQETRGYSLLILLTILLNISYFRIWQNNYAYKTICFYLFVSLIIVYTHFYSLFIILIHLAASVFYPKFSKVIKKIIIQILCLILIVSPIILVSLNYTGDRIGWISKPTITDLFFLPTFLSGINDIKAIAFLFISLVIIILFNKSLKLLLKPKLIFLLLSIFIPTIITFTISVFIFPIYYNRYLLILLPFYILTISYLINSVNMKIYKYGFIILYLSFSFIYIYNWYTKINNAKEDWRSAAAYVAEEYEYKDKFYFFKPSIAKPFMYYFGKDILISNEDINKGYILNGSLDESKYLWLILGHDNYNDQVIKEKEELISRLHRFYAKIGEKDFFQVKVIKYKLKKTF